MTCLCHDHVTRCTTVSYCHHSYGSLLGVAALRNSSNDLLYDSYHDPMIPWHRLHHETQLMSHANEPWQVAAAVAAVRFCTGPEDRPCVSRLSLLVANHASRREPSQEINNHNIPILISPAPRLSRKRSRSPSSPFYPDATTFSDGKLASETLELNPEDVTARLEDIEVEINTLRADTEDKELLISELQDFLASAENEISLLQIRADDAESRRAEDHEQI
ncbi:hypothetical protein Tco_0727912 [Tanacetum coccineum]|uniref:Uncharacterized protein n=1 Tax=Tanacetum coccineum TaxID=301880 RepID=A0ABQ4YLZ3_9ASTR